MVELSGELLIIMTGKIIKESNQKVAEGIQIAILNCNVLYHIHEELKNTDKSDQYSDIRSALSGVYDVLTDLINDTFIDPIVIKE
jgi:hypothetical protein